MNYEKMSDKEINLEVAKHFYDHEWLERHEHLHESSFDYCNNPADAWPIIESIWCKLIGVGGYDFGVGLGETETTAWNANVHKYKCSKLKAAMICFLKIKDAENAQDS